MTEEELDGARQRLLQMRKTLLQEVRDAQIASRELGQDGVPDLGDMSSTTYSRDVLLNLSQTQQQMVRDIDAALERIASGEYGICMRCEEEIAPRRLDVRPFSRYCIDCKSDIEKFGE
jgi:RNA polymerase-binding transcription factor